MSKLDRQVLIPVVSQLAKAATTSFYQKDHLSEELVKKWITDVLADRRFDDKSPREAYEEIKWLVRRGSGLSGSEIAPLILDKFDRFHPFSSTREVVAQKLFKQAPFQDPRYFIDTQRGHKIEEIARARFRELAPSLGLRPNDKIIDALRGYRHPRIRSMIGTPDEALDDLRNPNTVVIADYKAPRPNGKPLEPRDFNTLLEELLTKQDTQKKVLDADGEDQISEPELMPVDETDGKLFDYYLQLHQYGILEKARSADPNLQVRLILVRWCGVAGDVVMDELPWSPVIEKMICDTHDEIWNGYVMSGIVPPFRKLPELDQRDVPEDLEELASHYVMAKMLEQAAGSMLGDIQDKFKEWVQTTGYLNSKLPLGYLDVSGKPKYDEEGLLLLAEKWGVDPDDHREKGKTIDHARKLERIAELMRDNPGDEKKWSELEGIMSEDLIAPGKLKVDKLVNAIIDAGGDPTFLREQSFYFRMPQGKSERAEVLQSVKKLANSLFENIVSASISRGPDEMAKLTTGMSEVIKGLKDQNDLTTEDLIQVVNRQIAALLEEMPSEQEQVADTSISSEFELDGEGQAPLIDLPPVKGGFPIRPETPEDTAANEDASKPGVGFASLKQTNPDQLDGTYDFPDTMEM